MFLEDLLQYVFSEPHAEWQNDGSDLKSFHILLHLLRTESITEQSLNSQRSHEVS
jgi:hypothetical protein